MSIAGIPDPDRIHKKPFHRRNDSGELDVFEASRYFSGATEVSGYNGASFTHKTNREDQNHGWRGGGARRISLDMPLTSSVSSQTHHVVEKQMKEKKNKQPSSPGGRLASFLNFLVNQTTSKKKKPKSSSTTQSLKDEDESSGGRRKRRSSISHFRSASAADSKSVYSSSGSGFRTPPPYPHTPAKHVVFLRKYNGGGDDEKPVSLQHGVCDVKKSTIYAGLDDEFQFSNGFSEKIKNNSCCNGFSEKDRKFNEVVDDDDDDGGESDSSSDLFELENYDLGFYSSGLPVYETTHMDNIKRGAPISNGA